MIQPLAQMDRLHAQAASGVDRGGRAASGFQSEPEQHRSRRRKCRSSPQLQSCARSSLVWNDRREPHLLAEFPQLPCELFNFFSWRSCDMALQFLTILLEGAYSLDRLLTSLREYPVAFRLFNQSFISSNNILFTMTDQREVAARS